MTTEADYRLPRTVIPSHYDLSITPNFETFFFEGRVDITAEVVEKTTEIVLNCIEIDIDRATITDANGHTQEAALSYDPGNERVTLIVGTPLELGRHFDLHRLHRDDQRQSSRLLSVQVRSRQGREGHRHHSVRSYRRPPGLSVLGRTRPESHLFGHAHRAGPT